ncbi:hypothetical protein FGIG_09863 [Fasciola gigantica]|uniref:Uncharacterized protein n=1 Tax=Fasciola gigantica TaxID=46835 RepID=A0A504Z059_FASGI|nr:hypothetical protein FGIG_09863 [Fasciola gigantica]
MTDQSDLSTCSQVSIADGKLTEVIILLRSRGEQLDTISKVNLWGLGISDASILSKMTNLRIVSMSTNLLCSLAPFSACVHLQELYLRSNQIADIHQVGHLKFLTKLRKLWLENNPCCAPETTEQYRYSIIRNLASLTHLDLKAVTQDERNKSAVNGILLTAPPSPTETALVATTTTTILPPAEVTLSKPVESQHNGTDTLSSEAETVRMDTSSIDEQLDRAEFMHVVENEKGLSERTKEPNGIQTNDKTIVDEIQTNVVHPQSPPAVSPNFDVNSATLMETNKIRHEYGLEPLIKSKISPPVRNLQSPGREQERLIRNAVFRLLRTLNSRSLEMVIHAAERQIYRLERRHAEANGFRQSVVQDEDWTESSNYDCTNYLDNTL